MHAYKTTLNTSQTTTVDILLASGQTAVILHMRAMSG